MLIFQYILHFFLSMQTSVLMFNKKIKVKGSVVRFRHLLAHLIIIDSVSKKAEAKRKGDVNTPTLLPYFLA